jgi:hypothetical protein
MIEEGDSRMEDKALITGEPGVALIDGHVHIHDVFDVAVMLDHASVRREAAAERLGLPRATPGVLMLTESQGVDAFSELANRAGQCVGRWRVRRTEEPISLHLQADDAGPLVLVAGRQIVTAERLEVLALGTAPCCEDGIPAEAVIKHVHAVGALAVLPWGFGKWVGKRGSVVRSILNSPEASKLFIGDNGGRLSIGPEPALFTLARRQGLPILPGTDPFPFAEQVSRPLGYGFVLAADVAGPRPGAAIIGRLRARRAQPATFGSRTGPASFVRWQLAMQWQKRRAGRGSSQ